MSELVAWLSIPIIILVAFGVLIYEYKQKQSRTTEQYQKDLQKQGVTGNALLRAGMLDLEKLLKPDLAAAIEQVEDEKQGRTKTNKQGDDDI
jgi:hypothetical protein